MAIETINPVGNSLVSDRIAGFLSLANKKLQSSLTNLASGSRLSNPSTDLAALAQALKLEAQVNRTSAAETNLGNAESFSSVQDGNLGIVGKALDRLGELALRAQDFTLNDSDRSNIQSEVEALQGLISDTGGASFNGIPVFSSNSQTVTTDSEGGTAALATIDLNGAVGNATSPATSVSTTNGAVDALATFRTAIDNLANLRSSVGANTQQIQFTSDSNATSRQNLAEAASRIRDLDFARESTNAAKSQVGVQSSIASLIQARNNSSVLINALV
ncbi:MAG: flagellin [Verrucomicrobia bacterium]|nr:flagellin [Verrucomicrobiota bacterium]